MTAEESLRANIESFISGRWDFDLAAIARDVPRVLDALEAAHAEVARLRAELERTRSLSRVRDEPRVGDSYTNGAIVKKIVSYSPEDDHFMWHDGKRISRSVLTSDPMWIRVP